MEVELQKGGDQEPLEESKVVALEMSGDLVRLTSILRKLRSRAGACWEIKLKDNFRILQPRVYFLRGIDVQRSGRLQNCTNPV